MELNQFFEQAFAKYVEATPSAAEINQLLEEHGEVVVNDHVAYRTFKHSGLEKERLADYFMSQGYEVKGEYDFEAKKLKAFHLEHPQNYPKVFISELLLEEFDESFKQDILNVITKTSAPKTSLDLLRWEGPWDVSKSLYDKISAVSEYAGWMLAMGYRPNHFTVNLNQMKKLSDIRVFNSFLKDAGFKLNSAGGEVKGSKEVLLEQSSIMADNQIVSFTDGEFEVPTCYYEFAKRYEGQDGKLYQGFVAKSADKIFESTHR